MPRSQIGPISAHFDVYVCAINSKICPSRIKDEVIRKLAIPIFHEKLFNISI